MNPRTLLLSLSLALAAAGTLHSADITWNGNAGDGLWSSDGNWSTGAKPGDGDRAKFTTDASVTVEGDISVGSISISDGKSPVFSGSGSLTVVNGSVIGGKGARFTIPVIFPEGVNATAASANQYGSTIIFDGGLSGGASVTSGGNVNYGIRLTNAVVTVPAVTINCSSFLQTSFPVETLTLTDTWADGNGNSPNIKLLPGFTVGNQTEVKTGIGVPTVYFTNEGAPNAVYFNVPSLRIGAGGRPTLSCEFHSGTNLVTVGSFVREPGALVRISNNKKSGTFTPGENAGFIIPGMPADAQGLCPAWVYNDSYRVRKLDNGALAPCVYNDYANLTAEISANDSTGLYRLHNIQNSALVADTDIDSLVLNGNFGNTDDNTMRLNLSDYDLRLHGGALSLRDYASKEISASGDGRLVFAAEQAVFIFSYDVNRIEISAPIAWEKPVGSSVEYPDFLMPSYTGAETVFSGEDQVHNWGGLFAEGRGKGGSLLIFDGPSDRTFHGPVGGRFWMRKRGTGTLTFAGEDLTRGRQVFVEEGTLAIAHNNALAINSVTNGATLRIENGIAWSKTVVVWENSVLEGSGTLVPGLNQNHLQPECIVRGGTTNAPATLSFGGQVVIPTNIVFDVGLSGTKRGKIHIGGKCTFRSNLDTKLRVRVSDVDGTAEISPTDVVTVLDWGGSTENYKAENISLVIENGTPTRIDTSAAKAEIDTKAKTITITGISTKRGTVLLFR